MSETPLLLKPELPSDEVLRAAWAYEDVTNLYHFSKYTLDLGRTFREAGRVDKLNPKPHADLCDFITNTGKYAGRLKNNWKLILLPRGTLKTSVASVAYPLWCLLRSPNTRILLDSETYAKSVDTLRAIKGLITTNQRLRLAHGELNEPISSEAISFAKANRGLPWNEDSIIIGSRTDFAQRSPSISVGGVDIVKVGMHYDIVIGDDYHSEKNITSREQIEKVIKHIQLMTSILDPGASFIIIGTRWDDKDAYGWIIEEIEGLSIKQPGIYSGKHFDVMVYPWRWGDAEKGFTYFSPEILNEETIIPLKAMHSAYSFSCQYMNDPIDEATAVFKESWIKDNVLTPREALDLLDGMVKFTCVDPAIGEGDQHDYSAIVTIGYAAPMDEEGKYDLMRVLLDVRYGHWNPDKLFEEIVDVYRTWRPVQVGFEAVSGFESFQTIFRERCRARGLYLPFNYYKRDTKISKDVRIRALAPMFQSGTFHMVKGAAGNAEFWEEYRRFPRAKHDDVLDALADVEKFGYFPTPYSDKYDVRQGPHYRPLDEVTGY